MTLTYDNLSYVPSSKIPEPCVPNDNYISQSAVMDSPLIPSFLPLSQLDDLVALLPLEVRDDGIVSSKFSPTTSPLS